MIPGPDSVIACPRCGALHRRGTLATGSTGGATRWSDGKVDEPELPDLPQITRCAGCRLIFWLVDARKVGEIHPAIQPGHRPEYQPRCTLTLLSVGPDPALLSRLLSASLWRGDVVLEMAARGSVKLHDDALVTDAIRLAEPLERAGATLRIDEHPRPPPIPDAWIEAPHVYAPGEDGFLEALRDGLARTRSSEVHIRLRAWWKSNDPFRRPGEWVPFEKRSAAARDNLDRLRVLFADEEEPVERLLCAEAAREAGRFEEAIAVLEARAPQGFEREAGQIKDRARRRHDWVLELPPR